MQERAYLKLHTEQPPEEIPEKSEGGFDRSMVNLLNFTQFDGQPRVKILEYLRGAESIHEQSYDFSDIEYQNFLLKTPSKAPEVMKRNEQNKFYFYTKGDGPGETDISYLMWDAKNQKFSRYIHVAGDTLWNSKIDSMVAIKK